MALGLLLQPVRQELLLPGLLLARLLVVLCRLWLRS